jgi:hypothetical protein
VTARREPQPHKLNTANSDPKLEAACKAARALLCEQGLFKAIKLARSELRRARRARSRKLYGFWAVVEAELEAARPDAERATAPPAADPPRATSPSRALASAVEPRKGANGKPGPRTAAGEVWTSIARSS